MPRRLTVLVIALLLFPATAQADWFPAGPIDGPNADVLSVGNVDLARDGTGAVAYLRMSDGAPHAFVSRLSGGRWRAPERVDPVTGAATEVKVAVGDDNRLAVVWIADGFVYANVAPGGTPGPGAFAGTVAIGGPDARSLDVDLGINGAAYAVWEQGGDVRASRLQDSAWTGVAPPLDVEPPLVAGTGSLRPKVAVSAEGYAVATWGERAPDGYTRVLARRVTGLTLSAVPQLLNVPGHGSADSPDIDVEDDGSYAWVVFRQDIAGTSRSVGRRLLGSQFEPFEAIDAGLPSNEPRIDMTSRGAGHAVAQGFGGPAVVGSWLDHDHFQPGNRIDSGDSAVATKPEIAAGDAGDIAIAWRTGPPEAASARARFKEELGTLGPEVTISRPELGPVTDPGVFIAGDRVGDFAVAMVQGVPGSRALTVAAFDRPPGTPFIEDSESYKRQSRPELRWRPGLELWGTPIFRVFLDGVLIGETTSDRLVTPAPVAPGNHLWMVEAVDQAGQITRSRTRTLRVDPLPPTLKVTVSGRRKPGRSLKITARARDEGGSGLHHVTVDYGDRSPTTRTATTRHRYRRGTFTLKVAAVDNAGNVARQQVKLRIR